MPFSFPFSFSLSFSLVALVGEAACCRPTRVMGLLRHSALRPNSLLSTNSVNMRPPADADEVMTPLEAVARADNCVCSVVGGGAGAGGRGAFVREAVEAEFRMGFRLPEAPEADADEDAEVEALADFAADLAAELEPVSGVGAVPTLSSRGAVFWRDPMRNEGESGPVADGDGGTEPALCPAPPDAVLLPDADSAPVGVWGAGRTRITDCETRVADETGCTCTCTPRAGAGAGEATCAFAFASAEAASCNSCCCSRALPPPGVLAAAMLLAVMTTDG